MILACQNISKSFGTDEILQNVSFHIEDKGKTAIIGPNGAGKSTLLKIIIGELSPDSGEIILAKGKTMGYLNQHQTFTPNNSIYEEILATKKDLIILEEKIRQLEIDMKQADKTVLTNMLNTYTRLTHDFEIQNGYAYKSEVIGVLKGLGFDSTDFEKKVDTLSGGQKTRIALGKLLLSNPDIILLDEPTNHLDMTSIEWLETFLSNYNGAVVIVAHDRYFLDKVVTSVVDIDRGVSLAFDGNYSAFAIKKAQIQEAQMKAYLNQQQEIKHQNEVITKLKSFNREKSIKRAESREKMLDKIERLDKPITETDSMHFKLTPHVISGNDVLTVRGLEKSFGSLSLFTNLNFDIKRGEKISIIGKNGTGKTTILKILNNVLEANCGEVRLGSNVKIGYYDQEHNVLHSEKTLFEELSDTYPNMSNTEIRNVLAAFLFTNDDVFKRIQDLSGGERGRVSLAKLMLSESNFLILDEPTNHLDIESKEILEQTLNQYEGTVLYVSHDRYFINKTADRILDLVDNTLINYIGNYDYYLEKKDELTAIYTNKEQNTQKTDESSSVKTDWKQQKEELSRLRKQENDLKKTEENIQQLEIRDKEIDILLEKEEIYTDVNECIKLNEEKAAVLAELEVLYELWDRLSE
jgi:ATPase components of ABC transporters with duplicated ATPase domains